MSRSQVGVKRARGNDGNFFVRPRTDTVLRAVDNGSGYVSNSKRSGSLFYRTSAPKRANSGAEWKYREQWITTTLAGAWNNGSALEKATFWVQGDNADPVDETCYSGQWMLCQNLGRVAQGTSSSQCIGNSYHCRYWKARYQVAAATTTTHDTVAQFRRILFIDRMANATKIGPRDVLEWYEQSGDISNRPFPIDYGTNTSQKRRFKVISDETINTITGANAIDGSTIAIWKEDYVELDYFQEMENLGSGETATRHALGENLCMLACFSLPEPLLFTGAPPDPVTYNMPAIIRLNSRWTLSGTACLAFTED